MYHSGEKGPLPGNLQGTVRMSMLDILDANYLQLLCVLTPFDF